MLGLVAALSRARVGREPVPCSGWSRPPCGRPCWPRPPPPRRTRRSGVRRRSPPVSLVSPVSAAAPALKWVGVGKQIGPTLPRSYPQSVGPSAQLECSRSPPRLPPPSSGWGEGWRGGVTVLPGCPPGVSGRMRSRMGEGRFGGRRRKLYCCRAARETGERAGPFGGLRRPSWRKPAK